MKTRKKIYIFGHSYSGKSTALSTLYDLCESHFGNRYAFSISVIDHESLDLFLEHPPEYIIIIDCHPLIAASRRYRKDYQSFDINLTLQEEQLLKYVNSFPSAEVTHIENNKDLDTLKVKLTKYIKALKESEA